MTVIWLNDDCLEVNENGHYFYLTASLCNVEDWLKSVHPELIEYEPDPDDGLNSSFIDKDVLQNKLEEYAMNHRLQWEAA